MTWRRSPASLTAKRQSFPRNKRHLFNRLRVLYGAGAVFCRRAATGAGFSPARLDKTEKGAIIE